MTFEVRVPRLAESVSDAVLVEWLKEDGAAVEVDEPIATLETDKAAVELAAQERGVLRHVRQVQERVQVDDVIARIEPAEDGAAKTAPAVVGQPAKAPAVVAPAARPASSTATVGAPQAEPAPAAVAEEPPPLSPAVRRLVEEHGLDASTLAGSGKGGRLLKEDVLRHLESIAGAGAAAPVPAVNAWATAWAKAPAEAPATAPGAARAGAPAVAPAAPAPAQPARIPAARPAPAAIASAVEADRVVPMSPIRQRIAERLVRAQHTAAILTTFNELDMGAVLDLRARYRESFEQRHGVRLGFMSFFARAVVLALRDIPELNAEIRGTDIVYHARVQLGVAVQTPRGLVVPVVREADRLSFAAIEREILRLAERARQGQLSLEELSGGTFTVSNGGVFGSLLSTPILNPPQSGILGMHKFEKRPVVVDDQVVVRPMMYVALSYDHRIVDGEQAVTFLVRVKERIEDPERMLLDV